LEKFDSPSNLSENSWTNLLPPCVWLAMNIVCIILTQDPLSVFQSMVKIILISYSFCTKSRSWSCSIVGYINTFPHTNLYNDHYPPFSQMCCKHHWHVLLRQKLTINSLF
jgi:hypothetical protein